MIELKADELKHLKDLRECVVSLEVHIAIERVKLNPIRQNQRELEKALKIKRFELHKALKWLRSIEPNDRRVMMTMRYLYGESLSTIGRRYGISARSVKTILDKCISTYCE